MSLEIELTGDDELIAYLEGYNVPGRLAVAVNTVVSVLRRFAASITPVDTGSMRDAWRGDHGRVYIDPTAVNTRSGVPVTDYSGIVSERTGIMEHTMAQGLNVGSRILEEAFGGF